MNAKAANYSAETDREHGVIDWAYSGKRKFGLDWDIGETDSACECIDGNRRQRAKCR